MTDLIGTLPRNDRLLLAFSPTTVGPDGLLLARPATTLRFMADRAADDATGSLFATSGRGGQTEFHTARALAPSPGGFTLSLRMRLTAATQIDILPPANGPVPLSIAGNTLAICMRTAGGDSAIQMNVLPLTRDFVLTIVARRDGVDVFRDGELLTTAASGGPLPPLGGNPLADAALLLRATGLFFADPLLVWAEPLPAAEAAAVASLLQQAKAQLAPPAQPPAALAPAALAIPHWQRRAETGGLAPDTPAMNTRSLIGALAAQSGANRTAAAPSTAAPAAPPPAVPAAAAPAAAPHAQAAPTTAATSGAPAATLAAPASPRPVEQPSVAQPSAQLLDMVSLTRFENPLTVTLTDPDGHAALHFAGATAQPGLVLNLRNTAAAGITLLKPGPGDHHLALTLRRSALDPALLNADDLSKSPTLAVRGVSGNATLKNAAWTATFAPAAVGTEWVTLRLTAALDGQTMLPPGGDIALSLALAAARGCGARGIQVTIDTNPETLRWGQSGLVSRSILHLALLDLAPQDFFRVAFRGPNGDRLPALPSPRDLTLHLTAAPADVQTFRQWAGVDGIRPMQVHIALPADLTCDAIIPPATVTGGASEDGSGLWRFTLPPAIFTNAGTGTLDLAFTVSGLKNGAWGKTLGAVEIAVTLIDLPLPAQPVQRAAPCITVTAIADSFAGGTLATTLDGSFSMASRTVSIDAAGNLTAASGKSTLKADGSAVFGGGLVSVEANGTVSMVTAKVGLPASAGSTTFTDARAFSIKADGKATLNNNTLEGTLGRNYFKDSEKYGGTGLRVGSAWGMYGIFAEDGACAIGGKGGTNLQNGVARIDAPTTQPATPTLNIDDRGNLTVTTAGRAHFKDSEKSDGDGLRVGAVWGLYGIYSETAACGIGGAGGVSLQNGTVRIDAPPSAPTNPSIYVDTAGKVQVGGTSGANATLHVHGPGVPTRQAGFQYMDVNGGVHWWGGQYDGLFSIWAEHRIYTADGINVGSDARLKRIIGRSDAAADLDRLAAIEIVEYQRREQAPDDPRIQRKVIAQQVETILPSAVTQSRGVVADIQSPAELRDGWIMLATDLVPGDRVKIVQETGEHGIFTVTDTEPCRFRTDLPAPEGTRLFVHGREVDDLRAVDYDAIAMLNVSASQALKARVETLETALSGAQAEIARLSGLVTRLLQESAEP